MSIAEIESDDSDIETIELLAKVYERMAENSKPLNADMAKVLSDNIFDLF